jgi:hypothetical protein
VVLPDHIVGERNWNSHSAEGAALFRPTNSLAAVSRLKSVGTLRRAANVGCTSELNYCTAQGNLRFWPDLPGSMGAFVQISKAGRRQSQWHAEIEPLSATTARVAYQLLVSKQRQLRSLDFLSAPCR